MTHWTKMHFFYQNKSDPFLSGTMQIHSANDILSWDRTFFFGNMTQTVAMPFLSKRINL